MVDATTQAQRTSNDVVDKLLFARMLADDAAAFSLFVARNQTKMSIQIYNRIYDHAESWNTLQVLFVQLYRKGVTFEGRSRLNTWMVSVVRRVVGAQNRRTLRERGMYREWVKPPVSPTVDYLTAVREDARRATLLPDSLRVAWVLCNVLKLSAAETAACLDTTVGAVWQRCYRAKEAMHVSNA